MHQPVKQASLFDAPEPETKHSGLAIKRNGKSEIELIAATNARLLQNGLGTLAREYVLATQGKHGKELDQHTRKYVTLT